MWLILGIKVWFNIRKYINIIYHINCSANASQITLKQGIKAMGPFPGKMPTCVYCVKTCYACPLKA